MTVNSLLKAALEPVAPVEADTYEGTKPTYITFGYISTPTDFGDDEPEHRADLRPGRDADLQSSPPSQQRPGLRGDNGFLSPLGNADRE